MVMDERIEKVKVQTAVQLIGPDEMRLNQEKPIPQPGPYQIFCRIEAVGLCFSDLKLLKQFSSHARKSDIISGIDKEILSQIPSYVPCRAPTVPGHEAVVRILAVGDGGKKFKRGERYLVQADYRWLPTANSNAAFGYNFEGALQEYVLMDERVIIAPDGKSTLLPVSENLSAAAAALVEPWACVEDAYTSRERGSLKNGGQMAIIADLEPSKKVLQKFLARYGRPKKIFWISQSPPPGDLNINAEKIESIGNLSDNSLDDIIYLGHNPDKVEGLFAKLAAKGLLNLVLCGRAFGRDIACAVGQVHYGGMRIIGTAGSDPAESMQYLPENGEIRKGDRINVIGAGGPMGVMHVIRNICQGIKGIKIFAGDTDEKRLAALNRVAEPLARKNNIEYQFYISSKSQPQEKFDYAVVMAPVPDLVALAVRQANEAGIINIFAGIPANVSVPMDLDGYIRKKVYFIGTSGSTLADMERLLEKVEAGRLNTNLSVAAVSGLEGAVEGIRAVERHLISGKIIVYPACKGLGLVPLEKMPGELPRVAKYLDNGFWTQQAEKALWEIYMR